ncbi:hypothetical protein TB1_031296 [Malus domestica]
MRRIPSKLFQSKWRTTLVSTSHKVDERPCTTDNLGESTFATHRDPTCPGRGIPKYDKGRHLSSSVPASSHSTSHKLNVREVYIPVLVHRGVCTLD